MCMLSKGVICRFQYPRRVVYRVAENRRMMISSANAGVVPFL